MKRCPKCNKTTENDLAKFCKHCGSPMPADVENRNTAAVENRNTAAVENKSINRLGNDNENKETINQEYQGNGIELEYTEPENRVSQKHNDANSSSVIPKRIIKIIGGIAIILFSFWGIYTIIAFKEYNDYYHDTYISREDDPDFSKHICVFQSK